MPGAWYRLNAYDLNPYVPLEFTDDFARSDGAVGNGWTGATWTIVSGEVTNTPSLGSELLANGDMELWWSLTNLQNWIEAGPSVSINRDGVNQYSGSYCARFDLDGSSMTMYQEIATSAKWYLFDAQLGGLGMSQGGLWFSSGLKSPGTTSEDPYTHFAAVLWADASGANQATIGRQTGGAESIYADEASLKALTTTELFLTRPIYPTSNYLLEVDITGYLEIGSVAGIVFALDDPTNPQNFCFAQLGGWRPGLYQIKAGVRTDLIVNGNPQSSYIGSGKLSVAKRGDDVRIFLDDVLVDVTQTLDSTVSAGLYAGIFLPSAGETMDNWLEKVCEVGESTAFLDPYFA